MCQEDQNQDLLGAKFPAIIEWNKIIYYIGAEANIKGYKNEWETSIPNKAPLH